jgi:hypothetical protein
MLSERPHALGQSEPNVTANTPASSPTVGGYMVAPQPTTHHLLIHVPDNWTNDEKGTFFENFVGELLRPMRFSVLKRIRFTGMEIDLLAKAMDEPRTVFVECKAQRDALPADVIQKLFGKVELRHADAGWLFSTSDLGKEARGEWEEIQADTDLARRFTWYSPAKTVEVLITQGGVIDPVRLTAPLTGLAIGDATLVCAPDGKRWLIEILEEGLPAYFVVFDAVSGAMLPEADGMNVAKVSDRFGSLKYKTIGSEPSKSQVVPVRAPVARVVSGDAWDDLRPSRPMDFVGRDDAIQGIIQFVYSVREGKTSTRTFAIQGPSGWGKSSLVLKLGDLATKGRRIQHCSLTAVDSRSATNSAFVSGAIRSAFIDAVRADLLPKKLQFDIKSLIHPLDSPDVVVASQALAESESVIVLVFDQFEELFAKEPLFETFTAIRELSLDLDSKQIPLVLGFAWKTDISLPQQHPAYHLWHELADRRRDFQIRQFGTGDIVKVVSKAEADISTKLTPALRGRLVEQCQGYPWLLKKLLVQVAKRLRGDESQFALLERELDVEVLFKEDLAGLSKQQLQCLKYVATKAPVAITEVEEHFSTDTTNFLVSKRLLVKSGLNYVVYWDIFRDYLTEGRVPQIPWARTFQRDPRAAIAAVQAIKRKLHTSAADLATAMGGQERATLNLLSDLVALQLVDRVAEDSYVLPTHIKSISPQDLAEHIFGQFSRHVMCRELASYDRDTPIPSEELEAIVRRMKPPGSKLSATVVRQYALNLKRWLLFAGHLEERSALLYRPAVRGAQMARGAQMGIVPSGRSARKQFMGCGTTDGLLKLLKQTLRKKQGIPESEVRMLGLRNAMYDAIALGLVSRADEGLLFLMTPHTNAKAAEIEAKRAVLQQPVVRVVSAALQEDKDISNAALGERLKSFLKANWKQASALRYANGIRGFYMWAKS